MNHPHAQLRRRDPRCLPLNSLRLLLRSGHERMDERSERLYRRVDCRVPSGEGCWSKGLKIGPQAGCLRKDDLCLERMQPRLRSASGTDRVIDLACCSRRGEAAFSCIACRPNTECPLRRGAAQYLDEPAGAAGSRLAVTSWTHASPCW